MRAGILQLQRQVHDLLIWVVATRITRKLWHRALQINLKDNEGEPVYYIGSIHIIVYHIRTCALMQYARNWDMYLGQRIHRSCRGTSLSTIPFGIIIWVRRSRNEVLTEFIEYHLFEIIIREFRDCKLRDPVT